MKLGEEKRRELVNELKRREEHLIAKAVESSIGCRLENRVLYLQYPQPSLNSINARILRDSEQKPKLDSAAKEIGIKVLVF